jgi:poly(hydroxyalkanoate) depolymerase family esterase
MPSLGQTIAELAAQRRQWEALFGAAADPERSHTGPQSGESPPARLDETAGFGTNPGRLRMLSYVPATAPTPMPLVVVLHGCTQTAAAFDVGAGWSALADRHGFALLYPEQRASNNPKACFSWFRRSDSKRDRGEALSIREMIEQMANSHPIDRGRIHVTGFSAGGAMASVMLATYPEMFAGGAIVAGLPYGAATGAREALRCMFEGRRRSAREWGDLVRAASPHQGPWPRVSVWHGADDRTVVPMNAGEIAKQWANVHGLPQKATLEATAGGHRRRVWQGPSGDVIEEVIVAGLGHGAPLEAGGGVRGMGEAGGFFVDAGISSSQRIIAFWGLARAAEKPARGPRTVQQPRRAASRAPRTAAAAQPPSEPRPGGIRAAFARLARAVGLMRGPA